MLTTLCLIGLALAVVLHKCVSGAYGTARTRNV